MVPDMPLFIYGTLRDAEIVSAVLGRPIAVETLPPAEAPGFAAVYYPGRAYPALVPQAGASAPGLLISDLSPLDLTVLDAFEGEEYRRTSIVVHSHGADLAAVCYLPTLPVGPEAAAWTLDEWTQRHKPGVITDQLREARAARRQ